MQFESLFPIVATFLGLLSSCTCQDEGGKKTAEPEYVLHIENNDQYLTEHINNKTNLVIVDYTATWCGPCKMIGPPFLEYAKKYLRAKFLKVDTDECRVIATDAKVTSMPTFVFYRNGIELHRFSGANKDRLETQIKKFYGTKEGDDIATDHINLVYFLEKRQCECLNASREHGLLPFLGETDKYLESDADAQLIISLVFEQPVKVHSLKIKAPATNGPKKIKLFVNKQDVLGFDVAESYSATQELELQPADLAGRIIVLNFVKFVNVHGIQIFVENNQTDETSKTRIDSLTLIGEPVSAAGGTLKTQLKTFAKILNLDY